MKAFKRFCVRSIPYLLAVAAFLYCYCAANGEIGLSMTTKMKGMLVPICCWVVMALSLNLVVGISGELSLGHAGFMSVGCFSGVVASTWLVNAGVTALVPRIILTLAFSGVMAMIAGFIVGIPVLRLSGDYLAIVTLAFGEIIRNVMNCAYVGIDGLKLYFSFVDNHIPKTAVEIIKGPEAMNVAKDVKLLTQRGYCETGFITGFILIIFTLFVVLNLIRSRSGRAIMAVRDNRIAAESSGVDVMKYRLMAFVISAMLAGMAGALFGLSMNGISPDKFKFDQSITVLVFVVMGGIGNMSGSMISAAALTILPEKLRFLQNYRMLAYAIMLIVIMLITNSAMIRSAFSRVRGVFARKTEKEVN